MSGLVPSPSANSPTPASKPFSSSPDHLFSTYETITCSKAGKGIRCGICGHRSTRRWEQA